MIFSKMSTKNSVVDKQQDDRTGAGILITRPQGQNEPLKKLVLAHGGQPYIFPTLEINYTPPAEMNLQLASIQPQDIIIFISVNAVIGMLSKMDDQLYQRLLLCNIAAIGARTQSALATFKLKASITPDPELQYSEGLLQHRVLQVLGDKQVFIVRAQSGRNFLRDELQVRGATVEYIQAYHRHIPEQYDASLLIKALQQKQIQFTLLTSLDAYLNLRIMLGSLSTHLLKQTCLVVPSKRIARKIKIKDDLAILIAANASDESMFAVALKQRRST